MPIYEYECSACKKRFELFVSVNETPPKKCIHCKRGTIKKLVSNCSFQLKGTGWYITDYGRKDTSSGRKKKQPKETSSGDASASSSASSETKKASESTTSEAPKTKAA